MAARVAVRGGLKDGAPLLPGGTLGSGLTTGEIPFVYFALVIDPSRFVVVVILDLVFPAVTSVELLPATVASGRCFRSHGYATAIDFPLRAAVE